MATITTRNGKRILQFANHDGKRLTCTLGKMTSDDAAIVKANVGALEAARNHGVSVPATVLIWLDKLSDDFYGKLAVARLCEPRKSQKVILLEKVLDDYISARPDAKLATVAIWKASKNLLVQYFGADRDVSTITKEDARDFRNWLLTNKLVKSRKQIGSKSARKLSPSTAHKRLRLAKSIFGELVEDGILTSSPFKKVTIKPTVNEERNVYVTTEQTRRLMEACPDAEWRLLVALGRFGGLRNPCEGLTLKWQHIDWQREVIQIHSPKTGTREIPIFPELQESLRECWETAPEGATFVIARHRSQFDISKDSRSTNLTKPLMDIRAKAGLPSWPKPWHALRAAFVTDLVNRGVPIPTAAKWTGHSPAIMTKHYLRAATDDHARAIRGEFSDNPNDCAAPALQSAAKIDGNQWKPATETPLIPEKYAIRGQDENKKWAILGSNQ